MFSHTHISFQTSSPFLVCKILLVQETCLCLLICRSSLQSCPVWSNYRPVGHMWPATAFSVACRSIQEKSSKLQLVEKWVRLYLSHWIFTLDEVHLNNNTFSVQYFVLSFYFTIKLEGKAHRKRTCLDNHCFFSALTFIVLKSTPGTINSVLPNKSVCLSSERGLLKVPILTKGNFSWSKHNILNKTTQYWWCVRDHRELLGISQKR